MPSAADATVWKRYPHVPTWGDPRRFTLPAADGVPGDLGVSTYFVEGFLHGRRSGRRYAFMTIFTDMRVVRKLLRASFYTFACYDLDRGTYGTFTDYDFPHPLRWRRTYKLRAASTHLGLDFASAAGPARWHHACTAPGTLRPFAWTLALPGIDHHARRMDLDLEVEADAPPAPLGGLLLRGEMMFLGAPDTYSYFQSALRFRGHLRWGDVDEDVDGQVGWIDRQWAPSDFTAHQDWRSTRYRSEWRVMHFDDGWNMSLFHQYLRPARNAVVPWSGLSAQGPAPEFAIKETTRVELGVPEFIRSPGVVRAMSMLTEGPRYFPYRYRVRVPDWEMDVAAQPFVAAPAHGLPIEYWTGPVHLAGTLFGRSVTGLGFDERARPWVRHFELAAALRLSVDALPDGDLHAALVYRLAEVEALALRNRRALGQAHLDAYVVPLFRRLPDDARTRLQPLLDDLRTVL
jgi:hypothetical protein